MAWRRIDILSAWLLRVGHSSSSVKTAVDAYLCQKGVPVSPIFMKIRKDDISSLLEMSRYQRFGKGNSVSKDDILSETKSSGLEVLINGG